MTWNSTQLSSSSRFEFSYDSAYLNADWNMKVNYKRYLLPAAQMKIMEIIFNKYSLQSKKGTCCTGLNNTISNGPLQKGPNGSR